MLVFTPKGNIPHVAQMLHQGSLFLDHPTPANSARLGDILYSNPHNPPAGGFRSLVGRQNMTSQSRWSSIAVNGKSVEVQRSQVDELFKALRTGDELAETEPSACFPSCFVTFLNQKNLNLPAADIATQLYPHQKRALTFLLEREREITLLNGGSSTLWQAKRDTQGRVVFYNIVTQRETAILPKDTKCALFADDVRIIVGARCSSDSYHRWD